MGSYFPKENVNENDKSKKVDALLFRILIGYFIFFIVLTLIIPDNVLDITPLLSELVQIVSIIAPTVRRWGIYSTHPQVAQLIYSFGIISIPFTSYMIFKKCLYSRIPSSFKKDEAFSTGIATFFCFVGSFVMIAIVLYVYPFPIRTHRILLDAGHSSLIGFAIGSAFWLGGTSHVIAATISMVIYRERIKSWLSVK